MMKNIIKWASRILSLVCCGLIGWYTSQINSTESWIVFWSFIGYLTFSGIRDAIKANQKVGSN